MSSLKPEERAIREREAIRRVSDALFQNLKVEEVVEQSLQIALEVVDSQAGCVLLAKPDTKELVFYHVIGIQAPQPGTSFPWMEGIAGTVFAKNESILLDNVKEDERHFGKIDHITGFVTHNMVALPLKKWEGHPIGVMEVMNKREGRFNQTDVDILHIIASFTAIAIEQARLFQEAKLAEVAKFLGNIGHDVKNLLMPVLCGAGLLKDEIDETYANLPKLSPSQISVSQKTCRELLTMLSTNAKRIHDRVKEIADCVKGLSTPPTFAPCQLSQIVVSVFDSLKLMAEERVITLCHKGLEDLPEIQADEGRLFNALYNLVNNAIAEVRAGGSVTISGEILPEGQSLHLVVQDTGGGMPPEIRDSLFSAAAISRKKGGTGLGTKIVKDVVDAHHGTILVISELGVGTSFHIDLPLVQPSFSH